MRGKSVRWWICERDGLVLPVPVDPAGVDGPTHGQSRGPGWRRSSRGLFVPADVDAGSPEQRIVEAASILPPTGGVTGWAGLRWLGAAWFDGLTRDGIERLPVSLAAGRMPVLSQPGLEVSEEHMRPGDVVLHDGLPITSAARSTTFLMRRARSVRDAVRALDMAAYNDLVSVDEAAAYAETLFTWTGIPQCRKAIALADENCWSPQETSLRLAWVLDAELPSPRMNAPLFDLDGRHLGTPDLLDVASGTVCEYEGVLHLAGAQRRKDRDREERYRGVGLEFLTVYAADLADRIRLADRMRQAWERGRSRRESPRRWTTATPHWWVRTSTVDQRRNLDPDERERWLRLRRTA